MHIYLVQIITFYAYFIYFLTGRPVRTQNNTLYQILLAPVTYYCCIPSEKALEIMMLIYLWTLVDTSCATNLVVELLQALLEFRLY